MWTRVRPASERAEALNRVSSREGAVVVVMSRLAPRIDERVHA